MVEGALSGKGESFALAVSTPGQVEGRFYEVCSRRPGLSDWHPIHISLTRGDRLGGQELGWARLGMRLRGAGSDMVVGSLAVAWIGCPASCCHRGTSTLLASHGN
jgi:hypothetical protein